MFAKLLKHEWKATCGTLGAMSLGALGAGVLGAVLLRILTNASNDVNSGALEGVLTIALVFLILGLVAYMAAVWILLLRRFYKNKFTDEGYLTFTLPAKSWEIFLSSVVNTLVWQILCGLVLFVAIVIMVGFGLGGTMEESQEIYQEVYGSDTYILSDTLGLSLLNVVVSLVGSTVLVLTCITLGATFAKKHKIMAAIGIYYGLSAVQSTLSTVVNAVLLVSADSYDAVIGAMESTYLCQILITTLLATGGYFLSVHMMKKNLNLP